MESKEGFRECKPIEKTEECEGGSCRVDIPFGQEWENELMKWSKKHLIGWIKKLLDEKNNSLENMIVRAFLFEYGRPAQVIKAMGELSELSVALNHHAFERKIKGEDVISEIADVEIICKCLRLIYGEELVNIEKDRKICRMIDEARKFIKDKARLEVEKVIIKRSEGA